MKLGLRGKAALAGGALFLLSGALFLLLRLKDPGYVFIGWGRWQVEMTAVALLLLLLTAFLLFYGLLRLLALLRRLPREQERRRLAQAHRELLAGLEALTHGRFEEAENHFLAAAEQEPSWLYHLYAARAAHLRGAFEERNELLKKVRSENEAAALIAEARWALEVNHLHHALEAIDRLLERYEATPAIRQLAEEIYRAAGRTEKLEALRAKQEG